MPSQDMMPEPVIPVRGQVQKTFVDNIVLSGFTDDNHFKAIIGEYLQSLSPAEQQSLMNSVHISQTFVRALPPFVQGPAEIRQFQNDYTNALTADPVFKTSFGNLSYKFCYIDPTQLIALQPWIGPRHDAIPTDELSLMKFALPNQWEVPAEINFIPPQGPIQILSSSPMFQGLSIDFDFPNGKVQLGPPKHLNLVQVSHFQGKYYLRNGYHRIADAIFAGIREFPCLLIEAFNPLEVQLTGQNFFNFGYVANLPRPPLVADFNTPAAIQTKTRERRYGMIVKLDISPINIGI